MSSTRRDFLSRCLGAGVAAAAVASVPKLAESKEEIEPPWEDAIRRVVEDAADDADALGEVFDAVVQQPWQKFHIETDLDPMHTKLMNGEGNSLLFIQEMFIQFFGDLNHQEMCWVGMKIIDVHKNPPAFSDNPYNARLVFGAPDRNMDCWPQLQDSKGRKLPFELVSVDMNKEAMINTAFVQALMPVKLSYDGDVSFMRCKKCGIAERCVDVPKPHPNWAAAYTNTAQRPCPACQFEGRQQLTWNGDNNARNDLYLNRVHMTPEVSLASFCDEIDRESLCTTTDAAYDRSWVTKGRVLVTSIVPTPSPFLTDIVLWSSEHFPITLKV